MDDPFPAKALRLERLEGCSRMHFVALQAEDIYTKQCPLTVKAQNPAIMGATLAGTEATR